MRRVCGHGDATRRGTRQSTRFAGVRLLFPHTKWPATTEHIYRPSARQYEGCGCIRTRSELVICSRLVLPESSPCVLTRRSWCPWAANLPRGRPSWPWRGPRKEMVIMSTLHTHNTLIWASLSLYFRLLPHVATCKCAILKLFVCVKVVCRLWRCVYHCQMCWVCWMNKITLGWQMCPCRVNRRVM